MDRERPDGPCRGLAERSCPAAVRSFGCQWRARSSYARRRTESWCCRASHPPKSRVDPPPARACGICACSRQFDGLTFQNQLRCAAHSPMGVERGAGSAPILRARRCATHRRCAGTLTSEFRKINGLRQIGGAARAPPGCTRRGAATSWLTRAMQGSAWTTSCCASLKGVPRTHVYRLLRKGEVRVNSKRARPDQRVVAGDRVRLPPVRRRRSRRGHAARRVCSRTVAGRDRLRGCRSDRDQQAGRARRTWRQRPVARCDRGAARRTARARRARSRASARSRDQRLPADRQAPRGAARPACAAARRAASRSVTWRWCAATGSSATSASNSRSPPTNGAAASATSPYAATVRRRSSTFQPVQFFGNWRR